MAAQNNFFAQMLILAVCLSSALASTSTRDPKELRIFRLSDSSSYRVPSTQFRNVGTQRQISSLINPLIGQQGLGPFFGYFPNFLTQPCPECQNCTVCPVVPVPPPPKTITECGDTGSNTPVSAAQNGTIQLGVPYTGSGITCKIILVTFYPKTYIKLNCKTIGTDITGSVTPTTDSTKESITPDSNFVSKGNVLFVTVSNTAKPTANVTLECSWINILA